MNVAKGQRIMLAAFCDEDCDDLDMRVFQGSTVLGEDILDDAAPMVQLQDFAGGTLRVRIEMPSCKVAPCAFRMIVFGN